MFDSPIHLAGLERTKVDPKKFLVGVGVRVVPAGIVQLENGPKVVRACLLLSPVKAGSAAACGEPIDIREWPERIERMLKEADHATLGAGQNTNVTLALNLVRGAKAADPVAKPGDGAVSLPAVRLMFHQQRGLPAVGDEARRTRFNAWRDDRKTDVEKINALWRRLLAPEERDWGRLVEALEDQGVQNLPGKRSASTPKLEDEPPDIRGVGRGQAALQLSLERARSLVARLALQARGDKCVDRDDECNLAAPPKAAGVPANDEDAKKKREADRAKGARDRLAAEKKAQDKVRDNIVNIQGGTTWGHRAAAYKQLLDCFSSKAGAVAQCLSDARQDAEALAAAIGVSLGRHEDAAPGGELRTDDKPPPRPKSNQEHEKDEKAKGAQTRLRTLQNQPSLARLFNLVVDVAVPVDEFAKLFPQSPGDGGMARFGFLSASVDCRKGTRRVWTVTKFRPGERGGLADVWPCTRAEMDLFAGMSDTPGERDALIAAGALSQIDGIANLASKREVNGREEPRFDIVTLDAPRAVEGRRTTQAAADAEGDKLPTLRTAGLALVDRWRESSALIQSLNSIARAVAELPPAPGAAPAPIVVDAEDLTVGYRLDVGVRSKLKGAGYRPVLEWRALCNRSIRFDDDQCEIEALLARVIPSPSDREAYDAAPVVMPARRVPQGGGEDAAYVEDTVGVWTGPPLGVDANSQEIRLSEPCNESALRLGQLYGLEPDPRRPKESLPGWKIPRQIFGGGYHFSLTPRLHGGVVRPLAPAQLPDFAVVPSSSDGPRRYLRHERIEAPLVTTPQATLARVFDELPDGLRESACEVVVRSQETIAGGATAYRPKDPPDKPSITSSYRVIVPPSVPAAFADQHNLFPDGQTLAKYRRTTMRPGTQDPCPGDAGPSGGGGSAWGETPGDLLSVWEAPPDGLQDVDYDDLTGGFPIYSFAKTSDGEVEKLLDRRARTSGDSIFRPRAADRRTMRADPYYPDPAASYIVIALRDLAGRVLPGVPLVVPVQGEKLAYPNVRPVAIEVVAHPVRSGQPPGHERMLSLMAAGGKVLHGSEVFAGKTEPATVRLDGGPFVKGGAGGVEATHVVVRLEPGESVEIDVWCLPTEDQLAGWFDVIESSALIAAYDAKTGKTCPDCSTFVTQLKGLKIEGIDTFLRQIALSRAGADLPICAGGQLSIPRGALRCMAKLAHDSLLARPTPEIAARETIRATHAIAKPHAAPSIGTRERPTIGVRRVDKPPPLAAAPAPAPVVAAPAPAPVAPAPVAPAPGGPAPAPAPAAPAAVGPAAPVAAPAAPVGKAPASVAVPSSEIVLDGSVTVHRPTTAFFEIRAQGPSLVSNAFDDHENRHRTPDEVARGLWPRSPVTGRRLSVQDIYGFDVNAKGVVTLRSERATLLRVDLDIPESGDKHAGNEPLELDELRKEAEKAVTDREAAEKAAAKAGVAPPRPTGRGNVVRMSRPFTITDTRARFLSMRAVAGSRTAWCFRDGKGDVFADDDATRHSDENKPLDHLVEVVCEAGKAPAKVAPLTILPAFSLRQTGDAASGFTVERRVKLRIRMRRPWFTSGEGERLGIVLWPPDILKGERITASGGGVTRDYDGPPEEAVIAMQAFEDEDLGPGGAFVTRWGLDPIKGGPGHLGWVMPPEAFGDLEGAAERPPKGVRWPLEEAVYVPRATIPLPVDEDGKARASLEAALLTFAPRFDIDHETWYCDVEVCPGIAPEPFIRLGLVRYQPHAPPELQVSEPVVEWAQAPPYRKVVVTLDKDDSRRVKVEASGPGRTHGSASPPGPETRIESWAQRPIMKVSVHRRRSNGVEEVAELAEAPGGASEKFGRRAERVWAPRTQKEWTEALTLHRAQPGPEEPHPPFAVRPKALGYTGVALTWKTDFLLAEAPLAPRVPETTYAVVVEEVEPMLPSTFVDEPIEPDVPAHETREEMTYSGPRFAAKVEIR